jgi:hypothetical protein
MLQTPLPSREREGPAAKRWEGEGLLCTVQALTLPTPTGYPSKYYFDGTLGAGPFPLPKWEREVSASPLPQHPQRRHG